MILCITALFFFCHWICGAAAPHIFEYDDWSSVFYIIFNLILFLPFFFCLIVFWRDNQLVFEKQVLISIIAPIHKQFYIKELSIMIGTQLLCDLLLFFVSLYGVQFVSLFSNFFAILKWTVFYMVIIGKKSNNIFRNFKTKIVIICVFILLSAVNIVWGIHFHTEFCFYKNCFELDSNVFNTFFINFQFVQTIVCSVFEFLIIALFCIFHHFSARRR